MGGEPGFHRQVLIRGRQEGEGQEDATLLASKREEGPRAEECRCLEAGRGEQGFSPGSSRRCAAQPPGLQPSETLLRTLTPGTRREQCVLFKPVSRGHLSQRK